MLSWAVGAVNITRVVESELQIPCDPERPLLFAEASAATLRQMPWLYPDFVDEEDRLLLSIHALLVEAPGLRLVVDTCVGNDRARAIMGGRALSTPFLDHLEQAGWTPESVDAVVCTHLHVDHVGWNTRLVDGQWVPTFPRARYLIGARELDYWRGETQGEQPQILADSIAPIFEAGLAELVEMDHVISPQVRLVPSPGHTPGHVSVMIESEGEVAVITGDMTHHPCQLGHPEWSGRSDHDGAVSARVRREMFESWADRPILVIGTHYAGPTAGHVVRDGEAFRFVT